jgi:hypothetical protein
MSRALSRSLAVVGLLAVVSTALVVVTPSLARIVGRDHPHHVPQPTWLWQSHVYGGSTSTAPAVQVKPRAKQKPLAKHGRRPYEPPVDRWSQP